MLAFVFGLALIFGICFAFFFRLFDRRREQEYLDRMYDVFLEALTDALHTVNKAHNDKTD